MNWLRGKRSRQVAVIFPLRCICVLKCRLWSLIAEHFWTMNWLYTHYSNLYVGQRKSFLHAFISREKQCLEVSRANLTAVHLCVLDGWVWVEDNQCVYGNQVHSKHWLPHQASSCHAYPEMAFNHFRILKSHFFSINNSKLIKIYNVIYIRQPQHLNHWQVKRITSMRLLNIYWNMLSSK